MPKILDITRILREQKEQLRAGFQDRLVMTASITLRMKLGWCGNTDFCENFTRELRNSARWKSAKTLVNTRLFEEYDELTRGGFQDRLVMTASITLQDIQQKKESSTDDSLIISHFIKIVNRKMKKSKQSCVSYDIGKSLIIVNGNKADL